MFLRLKGFVEGLIEAHSLHCSTVQVLLLLPPWCAISFALLRMLVARSIAGD
jgi:hypothetical protein